MLYKYKCLWWGRNATWVFRLMPRCQFQTRHTPGKSGAATAWQLHKNRSSGLLMKGLFLWLGLTGYALYYFASDSNENWQPLLHWGIGLSVPLLLLLHIRQGQAALVVVL